MFLAAHVNKRTAQEMQSSRPVPLIHSDEYWCCFGNVVNAHLSEMVIVSCPFDAQKARYYFSH